MRQTGIERHDKAVHKLKHRPGRGPSTASLRTLTASSLKAAAEWASTDGGRPPPVPVTIAPQLAARKVQSQSDVARAASDRVTLPSTMEMAWAWAPVMIFPGAQARVL